MATNPSTSAVAAEKQAAAPTALYAADPKFLLELIVAELHWTSLQIAMLCMMATACAAPGSRFSLHSFRHLAYDDTLVMRLILRYGQNAGLTREGMQKLDALYADVSLMQQRVQPYIEASTLSQPQLKQLARILPTLCKLALACADALGAIEPITRACLHPNYVHDSGVIQRFLGRAAAGELGEIDRFGALTPPSLRQRRQSPRIAVNRPCRLAFGGGEFEAMIVDASRTGLGVTSQAPLLKDQPVTVTIGGRRLDAVAVRRVGQQIGLQLKRPLAVTDPLFQAG